MIKLFCRKKYTVFHITHWKAGSQWINKIIKSVVPELVVLPLVDEVQFRVNPICEAKIYTSLYVTKQKYDLVAVPSNSVKFIVIRDLRDTLISAYFSLKISHPVLDDRIEEWRQQLNNMTIEDGLIYLMERWLPYCSNIQWSWILSGEKIYKYEELLIDDVSVLKNILIDKCKLDIAPSKLQEAILAHRFINMTNGRERGVEDITAHARKGIAGDWSNYFTDKVKNMFKVYYGDLLIASGYEKSFEW